MMRKRISLAGFAHFAQEAEVEDEIVLPTGAEIVQQFVYDQEKPVVGVLLV